MCLSEVNPLHPVASGAQWSTTKVKNMFKTCKNLQYATRDESPSIGIREDVKGIICHEIFVVVVDKNLHILTVCSMFTAKWFSSPPRIWNGLTDHRTSTAQHQLLSRFSVQKAAPISGKAAQMVGNEVRFFLWGHQASRISFNESGGQQCPAAQKDSAEQQASHEALFKGSFWTVIPQIWTPCAWRHTKNTPNICQQSCPVFQGVTCGMVDSIWRQWCEEGTSAKKATTLLSKQFVTLRPTRSYRRWLQWCSSQGHPVRFDPLGDVLGPNLIHALLQARLTRMVHDLNITNDRSSPTATVWFYTTSPNISTATFGCYFLQTISRRFACQKYPPKKNLSQHYFPCQRRVFLDSRIGSSSTRAGSMGMPTSSSLGQDPGPWSRSSCFFFFF